MILSDVKQRLKGFIVASSLALCACSIFAFSSPVEAEAASWNGSGKTFVAQGEVFAPVREFTESFQAEIGWVPYGDKNLVTFSDANGNCYEVTLNPASGLVQSYNGYYPYSFENGVVALPIQFYKDHY